MKRFLAAERHADDTLAGWIGHPAVRDVIERRKGAAEIAIAPISRHLVDQPEVAWFCWYVYGIAGIGPDWSIRRGGPVPWVLNAIEMKLIGLVIAVFRRVVQETVSELESAGVGVAPVWDGDHAAVGEMLLLYLDWDLPPRELAACLNPPGTGAIFADAGGTRLRSGTAERADTNLSAIRRKYEERLHGPRPRAPYAHGGKRGDREPTLRRREAVAKVLERFPWAAASKISSTFDSYVRQPGGQAGSPGGYLRQLLQDDAEPGEIVSCPAKSTLHEDLRALRDGNKQSA